MKTLGYYFFKYWVSLGLFFYYKRIDIKGLEHVPKDKPLLLLSNHQNALMDVLLIATKSQRKPWFLTRADVFKSSLFAQLFRFLQMLPVYRIRDGRANLVKNAPIFNQCGQLLSKGQVILLFPEANHSLQRRIRPLSKGFTRIIDAAYENSPLLDLQLLPIGQNYQYPRQVGDSVCLNFGKPISVNKFMAEPDFVDNIKLEVFSQLKSLTTHVEDEENYQQIIDVLDKANTNYLNPEEVNNLLADSDFHQRNKNNPSFSIGPLLRMVFYLINLPMYFFWRILVKPHVPEPEFEATFRFGFVLLIYPLFYLMGFILLYSYYDGKTACLFVLGHAAVNLILIKLGITSSARRK